MNAINYRTIIKSFPELNLEKIVEIIPIREGLETKNYVLKTDKTKYILKKYHEKKEEEIKYENDLLRHLESKDFPAPQLLTDIVYIDKFPCTVHKFIHGRKLKSSELNINRVGQIAALQARMHKIFKNFTPHYNRKRYSIFDLSFVNDFQYKTNISTRNIIDDEVNYLIKVVNNNKNNEFDRTIIHEDLTRENIICGKSKIFFLDFGESHYAEVISDISIAIKELIVMYGGIDRTLIKKYIVSYKKVNSVLTKSQLCLMLPLMRRRALFMLIYYLSKQDSNDSFFKPKIRKEIETLKVLRGYGKNEDNFSNLLE